MGGLVTKIAIFIFVLLLAYYLLVYYKGGTAYFGAGSKAFNSGVGTFIKGAKTPYAS